MPDIDTTPADVTPIPDPATAHLWEPYKAGNQYVTSVIGRSNELATDWHYGIEFFADKSEPRVYKREHGADPWQEITGTEEGNSFKTAVSESPTVRKDSLGQADDEQ